MNRRTSLGLVLASVALTLTGACLPDIGVDDAAVLDEMGATPDWHYIGPVAFSDQPEDYVWRPTPDTAEAPSALRGADPALVAHDGDGSDGRFGVLYVDFEEAAEYVASYDGLAMAEAAVILSERGLDQASDAGDDKGGDAPATKGLSHNVDNRISFENWSLTHSTLRRVGRVRGGCSGALFGNRLVLTAAHCIFDGSGNYLQFNKFAPRRNGSTKPYGEVTSQGAYYPIAYKNDGCHTNYTGSCVKNDWAILILPPNPWAGSSYGSPGYLGFAWAGDSTVAGWAVRNIGYPSCSSSMAPSNCQSHVAYGDLYCAGVSSTLSGADSRWPLYGTNGKLTTGCDTSGGHSGGPIYSYSPGSNGPYIVGNTVWNQCNSSSCNANTEYSSAGIRISQTLFDWMLSLRASYP